LNVGRTRDFEWRLQQLDSDVSSIFKDVTDYGANITDYESIFTPHDVYVTTNPKTIKSADAVTYDDNGYVIPLSERFNEDDVRFRKKEKAPETVSVQNEHQQTVISSADGAKVLKSIDDAIVEYEKEEKTKEKTFLGNLSKYSMCPLQ
jgi:hypothetical protein